MNTDKVKRLIRKGLALGLLINFFPLAIMWIASMKGLPLGSGLLAGYALDLILIGLVGFFAAVIVLWEG